MSKSLNRLVGVVLSLGNSTSRLELEDLNLFAVASFRGENHLKCAIALHNHVLCSVLITECVAADDDGLLPSRDEAGDSGNDDRFSKDGSS